MAGRGNGTHAVVAADPTRTIVYCVVPRELAKLHEPLRKWFARQADVEVVVEQRMRERRSPRGRRTAAMPEADDARRKIRSAEGRRVAERRATAVAIDPLPLPARLRRHAGQLAFLRLLEPSAQEAEDRDTAGLVIAFQEGDRDAFNTLYMRYFDRVYGYVLVALRDSHEAEDVTQQVFMRVFERLGRYEHRGRPFRAWLFTIVRNLTIDHLRRRVDVLDPETVRTRAGRVEDDTAVPRVLDWISDRELLIFIERLPLAQRQVLVLRYMLGLDSNEIAQVMERTPGDVRMLHTRALRFLRERLAALGREPRVEIPRAQLRRPLRRAHVLRSRRYALSL